MSRAEQNDRDLSTSEDPLPCLQSSKAEPLIRSRPVSDIYPFQSHPERSSIPYLLSGYGAQVQPMTAGPHSDEIRVNGINSSAWSSSVSCQPDGKPYTSRIMRLFSNSRKGPVPAHFPAGDGTASTHSSDSGSSGPQTWSGLQGLGVVDSFKKLRSSVLQGIQSRAAIIHDGAHSPLSNQDVTNGTVITNNDFSLANATSHLKTAEGCSVSNGNSSGQMLAMLSLYGSDIEDSDDEENDCGLTRNSRLSRSIRRAYGAGRISLFDTSNGRRVESITNEAAVSTQKPLQLSKLNLQSKNVNENTNVKVLSRLSKSAENLNLFKSPFRRKPASPDPFSPQEDRPRTSISNGMPNFQRTSSVSSADFHCHEVGSKKSPIKTKLKLVSSMNDLTVRHRQSPLPSPTSSMPMSPSSQLHDDYSRRVPCFQNNERQRRPLPVQAQTAAVDHSPLVHHQPEYSPQPHHIIINTSFLESPETIKQTLPDVSDHYDLVTVTSQSSYKHMVEWTSPPFEKREPSQGQEQPECILLQNEVTSDKQVREALLQTEDFFPTASSAPPISPTSLSESPISPTSPASHTDAASTEPSSIKPRRRNGHPRPRPLSDYGQLISRKHSIPEEVADIKTEERTANALVHRDCSDNDARSNETSPESMNGDLRGRRQRPISVIGSADLFPSSAELKEQHFTSPLLRPPIPSHRVPPYRGVSARFRPSTLSQSTPIGLDRVGRRRLHRMLSDGVSECSATLDDSVSEEEEEGSFDELTDVTPYLQSGVELSLLNEWINSGHAVNAEALWDHVTMEDRELAFKAGDVIRVLDASHKDWWWGRGADREAWFPSCFVRVRVNQEDSSAESVESVADQVDGPPKETHTSEHRQQMRTNVVQEILDTERIYIKHLKDICEGYIRQCRKRLDMFTELQLKTIFSNIEDIYKFHRQFLRELERKYNQDQPHLSEIGSCFLLQGEGFSIYSEYCNNHPAACAELQRLMKSGKYKHFFEACRLRQQMIDISIAGFLLTPVQKICKYPLQLGELLKYTSKDHSDHSGVSKAYEAMKNVASLINERKRRLESIDTIAHWQVAISDWEGSDVLERSSELIHSGELTRIVRQGKMQQRSFFLFDHQLVYCKKDILRRDLLHYRGRLDMDQTEVVDVVDGRDTDLGLSLKNALRLRHASTLEFVCVLCCRKAEDKQRWLRAFSRERNRVKEDQEMGMEISDDQRKRAIVNARRAKKGKIKTVGYSGSVSPHHQNLPQNLHPLHQRHITIPTSVPQQQVFSLAEPPKRKPYHMLYTITCNAFFRK